MPGLIAFAAAHWRALGALVIVLLLAGYIETLRVERDHAYKAEAQAKADLLLFKTEVAAIGKKADADRIAKEAADIQRKKDADAENSDALNTLAADIARLRNARSGRSFLPGAPSCPGGAAGADRYRANIDRALRDFDSEAQKLVDEGSGTTVKMNGAKKWAQSAPGSRK